MAEFTGLIETLFPKVVNCTKENCCESNGIFTVSYPEFRVRMKSPAFGKQHVRQPWKGDLSGVSGKLRTSACENDRRRKKGGQDLTLLLCHEVAVLLNSFLYLP